MGDSGSKEDAATATVLADPRSDAGVEDQRQFYEVQLALLELQEKAVSRGRADRQCP